jgi:hypothetical protein
MRHLLCGLFMLGSCLLNAEESILPQEIQTTPIPGHYVNSEPQYSIQFPYEWKWQIDFMGLDVFASAPLEEDSEATYSPANMSIISESTTLPPETFFNQTLANLERSLHDFKKIQKGDAIVNGVVAKQILFTHTAEQGSQTIKVLQYFIFKNNRVFIINCGALEKDFASYLSTFEHSVNTFKIK